MKFNLFIRYIANGEEKTAKNVNEDFDIQMNDDANHLRLVLIPHTPLEIKAFYIRRNYTFAPHARFMANGFQSWSDTKEFSKEEKMPSLGFTGHSPFGIYFGMKYVGDYTFAKSEKTTGTFHSHSFAYVREADTYHFVGSLNDRTGYTLISADMNRGEMRYAKDLEGKVIDSAYEVLDLFFTTGTYDEVFDAYFKELNITARTNKKIKGYTSWYNYYKDISEEIILRDLNAIASLENYHDYVNTFQIDDGYQTAVGDWFSIDREKFPHGMKPMADAIHDKGLQAGLWIAPFAAQRTSKLAKEHPDWLVKGPSGKPIMVGHNWMGFYALDIYNEQARQYIKDVFHQALDVWGFDLVKLDFLYAASVVPMHGKTRGEIAFESIDLLRECVGDKLIIGCGVQQMPCFGKVEYMRVGADMNLGWQHDFKRQRMHREDVSTPNAIHNTIYRRGLCGRAFQCDPDVFLLRHTNIHFQLEQQKLLGKFIKLFGYVLFMSDNVAEYDEEQLAAFHDILADDETHVDSIEEDGDIISIHYTENGTAKRMKFHVWTGEIYAY